MRLRFISFAGWLLVGLVLLAPVAQAGLVRDAANTVRDVVEPVTAPVTSPTAPTKPAIVPKAPSAPAPSPPPVEKVVKPVKEVTQTATNTVQAAAPGPAAGSGSGSSGSGSARSGGSTGANGGDDGGGNAAAQGTSGRVAGSGPGPRYGPGAAGADPGMERRHTSGPAGSGSIFSARPAPDPIFSAYVWPAIALGGAAGVVLAAMDLPVEGGAIPLTSELPLVLAQAAAVAEAFGAGNGMPVTAPPDMSDPKPLPYSPGQLPDSDEIWFILLLLLCLAPLTLFAYTIRREVKTISRWPHA